MLISAVMLAAMTVTPSYSDDPPAGVKERLTAIVTTLEAREKKHTLVRMKYQLTEHNSAELIGKIKKTPKTPGQIPQPRDWNITRFYDLALRESKFFLTSSGPFHVGPLAAFKEGPSVWIFDGRTSYYKLDDRYEVSSQPIVGRPHIPWEITGDTIVTQLLKGWRDGFAEREKRGYKVDVKVGDERGPNNEPLVRVEYVSNLPSKFVVWLHPDLDYAVHKYEQNARGGEWVSLRCDRCVYEVIAGKIYPRAAVRTSFKDAAGTVVRREELKVESIETNPEKIPDSLFHLTIPKDKPVYDRDTKKIIVDPKAIQQHLDALSTGLPGRPRMNWWPAALTFCALGVALFGVGFWWRGRKVLPNKE